MPAPDPAASGAAVDIVMRTRDRPLLLGRALDSVLSQDFPAWRLVVVNDGGDPGPVEALLARRPRLADRVRVLHADASEGMEAASNRGLAAGAARYVVVHDDDDSWTPGFLSACVAAMERADPLTGGVVTQSTRVSERIEGERVVELSRRPFNPSLRRIGLARMLGSNQFPPISFLYRRAALDRVGFYREDLPVLGDWEFNIRFLRRFEIAVIPEPLANYHFRAGAAPGAYLASTNQPGDPHLVWMTRLRNEWLREDLDAGRFGIGTMASLAGLILESRPRPPAARGPAARAPAARAPAARSKP